MQTKSSNYGSLQFRREFVLSFMDEIFMNFKDQNHFFNYICFIFIHLATKRSKLRSKHQT